MRMRTMAMIAAAFLVLPSLVLLWTNRTKHLTVKEIVITGNEEITTSEIIKRAGIWVGRTSMLFSSSDAEENILENPWIERVSVRKFLHGKVRIEISESEPFCVVAPENRRPYYVNSGGKKLGPAEAARGLDFPVISLGEKAGPDMLLQAIEILGLSKSSAVLGWSEISEIAAGGGGIGLITVDRRFINFGKDDMASKWRKVERIITHARKESLVEEYIDISSGEVGVISYDS